MFFKRTLNIVAAVAISLLAAWGISLLQAVADLENQTVDIRQVAFAPKTKVSDEIVMVWLDDAAMQNLPYRSPVPRDFLAQLNDRLFGAGAHLVAYDIFFKGRTFQEADAELAKSLEGKNAYAVFPMRPKSACLGNPGVPEKIEGCADLPDEIFLRSLKGAGLADLPFSSFDSVVRSAKFGFKTDKGNDTPSFAALLFKSITGKDAGRQLIDDRSGWPRLGPLQFSPFLDDSGRTLIRFAGPPGRIGDSENAFRIFSAKLIADGLVPASWIKDKVVLVGAAFEDQADAYLTPYYRRATGFARMLGVEIHANILSSLLAGEFFYVPSERQKALLVGIIAVVTGSLALLISPLKSAVTALGILSLEAALAVHSFRAHAVVVPIVLPLASGCASYGIGIGLRALTEGRQKRFIKGVFEKYVPKAVVDRMIKHPELLKLGGEERCITSLFTDIASFTAMAERMDPALLVAFLNDYLGRMNEVLFHHGATLDKYEGDAIIAFFNAPLSVENHEMEAGRAALGMRQVSREISGVWKDICGQEIVTRIGVHTGPAVVGNMGSEGRFDYTAIGDTVNLASRLEGANKVYGTTILASEETIRPLCDSIAVRPIDRVRVKGKAEAILLFEILDEIQFIDEKDLSGLYDPYRRAFDAFENRMISDAMAFLKGIIASHPDDGPSKVLTKRCERALKEPEWDLITDLVSK